MFSPRAENLAIPGRRPAAPRSRWRKLPRLAISAAQSPATRARSPSQSRAARPLARRSALRRSNRSLASFWAVELLPAAGGPAGGGAGGGGGAGPGVVGAAVGCGAGSVVVVAALVVVVWLRLVVVVGRPGRWAVPSGTSASSSVTHTQPALPVPTPMALKERLRMRR